MRRIALALAVIALAPLAAHADPTIKDTLPCKFGQSMENDHMLDIQNTTKAALKTETIVNLDIKTDKNGEQHDCFALTAPLAAGTHISHMEKMNVDGTPKSCLAFVSGKYPAIQHGSDGSSSTQCDY